MTDQSIGHGTVLAGRFRLEDLLQESVGAKFWRATDQILARSVAVHVIAATDPRAEALLVAARASATVTDVHFLRVLDAAEEDGVAYVVNEWAAGSSLDQMLTDGPLPARRAAWLVKEVAEAITHAHGYGVAHGRLIPENVMVTETGSVKLIGFVVDSVLNGDPSAPAPADDPTGAREGARGNDHDVTNLASLLYAALVGRWPGSDGSTLPEAPREHGRLLRPRQVRARVPRPLDAICERVLNAGAHQQAMPIETAHEICAALSDFIGDPTTPPPSGHEPTTAISRDDLATTGTQATTRENVSADPDGTQVATEGPAGGPPWSAGAAVAGAGSADPEETQAAAPLFFEDDANVGWTAPGDTSGGGPGLGSRAGTRPASPPPPLPPEPEPRPLFAPDPPGGRAPRPAPDTGAGGGPSTGHGTGSLPAVWGPDADDPEPAGSSRWEPKDAGKSWLRLAAIIAACLLLGLVVILAFNFGRGTGGSEATGEPSESSQPSDDGSSTKPLAIEGVSDFDPEGDPAEENADLTPLAVDGDPGTAWRTMTYFNNPRLGLLKDGVGLVVDLGEPVEVSQVQLTLIGRPTSLEVLAADEGAGLPTSTAGLQTVASAQDAGPQVDLDLDEPVTTQYLVVWLTSLPPAEGGFVGQVAEIVLRP